EGRQPAFSVYLQLAGALDTLLLVEQRAAQREGNGRRQSLRGDTQVVADQGQAILRRQARDQPSIRVGDEDPVWIVLADLQRRNGIDGRRQKSRSQHADQPAFAVLHGLLHGNDDAPPVGWKHLIELG